VLIVEAFSRMPDRKLVVIGDGGDMERVVKAAGPNVQVLGYQPFDELRSYMQRARAFVFAAEEDFGIAPVEAQACGTPVIAFGKGGVLETVVGLDKEEPTGVFYDSQTVDSIRAGVHAFEANEARFSPHACRRNAEKFSTNSFRARYAEAVGAAIDAWRQAQTA